MNSWSIKVSQDYTNYYLLFFAFTGLGESGNLIGVCCCLCEEDLGAAPYEGESECYYDFSAIPVVAILPCGHAFHSHCLWLGELEGQGEEPPCIFCESFAPSWVGITCTIFVNLGTACYIVLEEFVQDCKCFDVLHTQNLYRWLTAWVKDVRLPLVQADYLFWKKLLLNFFKYARFFFSHQLILDLVARGVCLMTLFMGSNGIQFPLPPGDIGGEDFSFSNS